MSCLKKLYLIHKTCFGSLIQTTSLTVGDNQKVNFAQYTESFNQQFSLSKVANILQQISNYTQISNCLPRKAYLRLRLNIFSYLSSCIVYKL